MEELRGFFVLQGVLCVYVQAAEAVWKASGCGVAPNGAAMRTSVLGIYQYCSLTDVTQNALNLCKITHADPRYHCLLAHTMQDIKKI